MAFYVFGISCGGLSSPIEAHAFDSTLLLMGLWSIKRLEPSHSYGIKYLLHLLGRAAYTNSSHFLLRPIILSRPIPLSLPTFFYRWLVSFFHKFDSLVALLSHIGLDLLFFPVNQISFPNLWIYDRWSLTFHRLRSIFGCRGCTVVLKSWIQNGNLAFFYI